MLERIEEKVKTLVSFRQKAVFPHYLVWRGRKYKIEKLNLVYQQKIGRTKFYYFMVSDSCNNFKLSFNTDTLDWILEEVYTD